MYMNKKKQNEGVNKNRYFPRMSVEILLSYRPESSAAGDGKVARTKTLGLGGFMFESEAPFVIDKVYAIDLVFGDEKMSARAKVVYSLATGEETYETGFAFLDLSDKQREELTAFFIKEYEKLPPENF